MEMINCRVCGVSVASTAKTCPGCGGAPTLEARVNQVGHNIVAAGLAMVVVGGGLLVCFSLLAGLL